MLYTESREDLHAHPQWRNANARAPEVLAAQRKERARVRAKQGLRWGRPRARAASPAVFCPVDAARR